MPLGGANIGWDNAVPAGSESVSLGDDRLRSAKTSIQQALDAEHVFPAAGGAGTGAHRPGSAVAFYGAQSAVSSSDTDGRLMFTSNTSRLFGTPSNGTVFIGGATVISHGSYPGSLPQRAQWVMEMGQDVASGNPTAITFPNSGFSGKPVVVCSAETSASGLANVVTLTMGSVTATGFNVWSRTTAPSAVFGHTIHWTSYGTRAL